MVLTDKRQVEQLIREQAFSPVDPVTEIVEFIDRHGRTAWGVTTRSDPTVYRASALVRKPVIIWPALKSAETR